MGVDGVESGDGNTEEDRKSLRNRQAIIVVIVWAGGGFLGTDYVMEHWHWSFEVASFISWLASLFAGFGCSWLITGKKFDTGNTGGLL